MTAVGMDLLALSHTGLRPLDMLRVMQQCRDSLPIQLQWCMVWLAIPTRWRRG